MLSEDPPNLQGPREAPLCFVGWPSAPESKDPLFLELEQKPTPQSGLDFWSRIIRGFHYPLSYPLLMRISPVSALICSFDAPLPTVPEARDPPLLLSTFSDPKSVVMSPLRVVASS